MKFTIVMTVFGRVELLLRALFTVVTQAYPHWELLILADGPHPAAERLVKDYLSREPRWADRVAYDTVARVPDTFGNFVRREGLERADGVYTTFMGHDCLYMPGYLSAHMENIDAVMPTPVVSSVDVACWTMRPHVAMPADPWLPVYLGTMPRGELSHSVVGDLDLTSLAFPTKLAVEWGVFGPAISGEYAADWHSFRAMMRAISYRHRAGVVAAHF